MVLSLLFSQRLMEYIYVGLFLGSLFCSTALFIYSFISIMLSSICSLVADLDIRSCKSSNFVLLQHCVSYSESFASPYEIRNCFVNIHKTYCWSFDITWNLLIKLWETDISAILNLSLYEHGIFLNLFSSSFIILWEFCSFLHVALVHFFKYLYLSDFFVCTKDSFNDWNKREEDKKALSRIFEAEREAGKKCGASKDNWTFKEHTNISLVMN